MDTRYHYLSIDSADDLSGTALGVALAPDEEGTDAEHVDADTVPGVDSLAPPAEGRTRYWWRVLVGPGESLDPTGRAQPLTVHWRIDDDPEQLSGQWVIGDPEPDELPEFSTDCWPVVIPSDAAADFDALPSDRQELAKSAAVSALRALTGFTVGGCPVELRPCHAGCAETTWQTYPVNGVGMAGWRPVLHGGNWLNVGCGCSPCVCPPLNGVSLPGIVGAVEEVWVDGELLDPSDWFLSGNTLLRADVTPWPRTQNLGVAKDQPGTFAVVYLNAWPVDAAGSLVAGVLAAEYGKAYSGKKCRLPANVTQVVRTGVTVNLDKNRASASQAFPDGISGIPEVDAWVRRYNPNGLRVRPTVWSPDVG